MGPWLGAVSGLVAGALVARLIVEWQRYQRGEHIISGTQLGLRVASALLVVGVLAMLAVGVQLEFRTVRSAGLYWGGCALFAGVAMMLALADLCELRRRTRARRAELYQRMSAYLHEIRARRNARQAEDQ